MSVRRELLGMAAYLVAVVAIVVSMYAALGIALTPPDPVPMVAASSVEPAPEPAKLAKPRIEETFTLSSPPPPPAAAAPAVAAKPAIKTPPYAKMAKEKAQAEMGARKKTRAAKGRAEQDTTETLGYAPTPRYGPFSTHTAY